MATKIIRNTIELDATGVSIGRLASKIAMLLTGKHKPSFEMHEDHGDIVVVKNAAQVKVTGRKLEQKFFYAYSGYPGGLRKDQLAHVMTKNPGKAITHAVKNMLPKNRLQKNRLKRLTVKND